MVHQSPPRVRAGRKFVRLAIEFQKALMINPEGALSYSVLDTVLGGIRGGGVDQVAGAVDGVDRG
jgi:hypothetical protein